MFGVFRRHSVGNVEGLRNETHIKIRACEASEEKFWLRMNGRHLLKSNNDEDIPQNCRDRERNIKS